MRTSNPALNNKVFQGTGVSTDDKMTLSGTVNKTFLLVAIVIASAAYSWQYAMQGQAVGEAAPMVPGWYWMVIILTLVLGFVIIFKKTTAPFLSPLYAAGEGLLLGTVSVLYEYKYPGIVLQAVMCTTGVLAALLMAYRSGLIRATENFKLGVVAATGGIAIVYLIDLVLRWFGMGVPFIHESGPIGIGISVVIVTIAALNLVLDFDFIEQGAASGAPKYMEWYGAFGLLVTLVWLYLEILRLLGKLRERR